MRWRLTTVAIIGLAALTSCNSDAKRRQEEQKKHAKASRKDSKEATKHCALLSFPIVRRKARKGERTPRPTPKRKAVPNEENDSHSYTGRSSPRCAGIGSVRFRPDRFRPHQLGRTRQPAPADAATVLSAQPNLQSDHEPIPADADECDAPADQHVCSISRGAESMEVHERQQHLRHDRRVDYEHKLRRWLPGRIWRSRNFIAELLECLELDPRGSAGPNKAELQHIGD